MTEKSKRKVNFGQFGHAWKGKMWFVISMFFSIEYLSWRIFFTIPFGHGIVSIIAGVSLLIMEALGMFEACVHFYNMHSVKSYELPKVPLEEYPDVDVFVATYSEAPELLYKTINGCKYMNYPDKRKVHIYLCDDNRRPAMRELAQKMGVNYLDRENNVGAKAGNLNNALAHSSSPYVVTFDADMIPRSDFLMKTIPYFVDAEIKNRGKKEEEKVKLGFLQSPQAFYNPDLFQYNLFSEGRIPNEQDYFYKEIQVAKTKTNSVIYGGSNTVLARDALEAIGGFYTEAITEDFATGILIQKAGYVSLGIEEPLASGMSATDLEGLIQQRVRWGRGVIATGKKMKILTCKDLSIVQKINYWISIWYWYAPLKRLVYVLAPLLFATFGFRIFECTLSEVLLFWLPMYITSDISWRTLSNNRRNKKWTGIYETILFPFMLQPVLMEGFGITLKKFKVTSKGVQLSRKGQSFIYKIPFLILIVLSAVGLMKCVIIMFDSGSFAPIVGMFWLAYNFYMLIMSFFFVDGRVLNRKSERVPAQLSCELINGKYHIEAVTRDISEGGVAVLLEKPYFFPEGEWLQAHVWSEKYKANLLVEVLHVGTVGDKWSYSMRILDYQDTYNEFLQLMYDRIPMLPLEIKEGSGSFEDLKLNTQKRISSPFYQKRKHPRIYLDADVEYADADSHGVLHIQEMNYCYVTTKTDVELTTMQILPNEAYCMECEYVEELPSGLRLYQIINAKDIWDNPDIMNGLLEWLVKTHAVAEANFKQRERYKKAEEKVQNKKEEFNEIDLV